MKRLLVGLILALFCLPSLAAKLDNSQLSHLKYAAIQAAPYGLSQTAAAIELQESSGCKYKRGIDPYSFGCMQLVLSTAQLFDINVSPGILMADDWRNIRIGVQYLVACKTRFSKWQDMVKCYHGIDAPNNDAYVEAIRRSMKQVPKVVLKVPTV